MNRYILIVTEKPDAAFRITTALDKNENPRARGYCQLHLKARQNIFAN
jgi:hypothetical protein